MARLTHFAASLTACLAGSMLAPGAALAALIDISHLELATGTIAITQGLPDVIAFDTKTLPASSLLQAESLSLAVGNPQSIPFPNIATTQTRALASSAADTSGVFGLGVSGFFFKNSLPPNTLEASGQFSQTITNTTTTVPVVVDFFIPTPTIPLFGVGNFFPAGADPEPDVAAGVVVHLRTVVTKADGSVFENLALDHGLSLVREPVTGRLLPIGSRDAGRSLSAFDAPDSAFGFQLTDLQVGEPTAPVPEPATRTMFAAGLLATLDVVPASPGSALTRVSMAANAQAPQATVAPPVVDWHYTPRRTYRGPRR